MLCKANVCLMLLSQNVTKIWGGPEEGMVKRCRSQIPNDSLHYASWHSCFEHVINEHVYSTWRVVALIFPTQQSCHISNALAGTQPLWHDNLCHESCLNVAVHKGLKKEIPACNETVSDRCSPLQVGERNSCCAWTHYSVRGQWWRCSERCVIRICLLHVVSLHLLMCTRSSILRC